MPEETKEEYIARHRKESGTDPAHDTTEQAPIKQASTFKEKLRAAFFLLLFGLFLWVILQIFGMMKSN